MPDDAGAAAGTADGAGTTNDAAGAGAGAGDGQGAATASAPEAEGGAAEDMLADAVSGDGADGDGDGAEDPAKQLAAAQAEAKKWRDLSKKNEGRARTNAEKAAEFDKLTEAQKTEQQRLTDRATLAEQRAAEAEGRYHRTLAAATYGLPPSLIDLLSGGTEDEINSSAEQVAAEINTRVAEQVAAALKATASGGNATAAAAAAGARQQRPVESMRAGAMPADNGKARTGSEWIREQLANR